MIALLMLIAGSLLISLSEEVPKKMVGIKENLISEDSE
jgi:hypothetical protein